jgi:hypothetical protein
VRRTAPSGSGRARSGDECAAKARQAEQRSYGTLLMPDPEALSAWLTKAVLDRYAPGYVKQNLRGCVESSL